MPFWIVAVWAGSCCSVISRLLQLLAWTLSDDSLLIGPTRKASLYVLLRENEHHDLKLLLNRFQHWESARVDCVPVYCLRQKRGQLISQLTYYRLLSVSILLQHQIGLGEAASAESVVGLEQNLVLTLILGFIDYPVDFRNGELVILENKPFCEEHRANQKQQQAQHYCQELYPQWKRRRVVERGVHFAQPLVCLLFDGRDGEELCSLQLIVCHDAQWAVLLFEKCCTRDI